MFAFGGGYGAFAHHIVIADVVVDALELFKDFHAGEEFKQQLRYQFAVKHCPSLAKAHIVEIVLASKSFDIA